jgi:hypothetical protein
MSHKPELPLRGIVLGSGGSGKTHQLREILLREYRNRFDYLYVFSASVDVDELWDPVKKYAQRLDGSGFYAEYDPEQLEEIIEAQKARYDRKTKRPALCLVCDDFIDDPRYRTNKELNSTFVRLRHFNVSTLLATQKYRVLNPLLRLNASFLLLTRLRSKMDYKAVEEELSAVLEPERLKAAYDLCVKDAKHGMLLINLMVPAGHENQILCGWSRRLVWGDLA